MKDFGLVVIGAHSGVHLKELISNYNNQNILLIEPVPYNYEILENTFKEQVNVSICKNAILNKVNKANFYFVKKDSISKLGKHWASQIGSFDKNHILNHKNKRFNIKEEDIQAAEIEFITFKDLVKKYSINSIDMLQIDVEGAEMEVLKGAETLFFDKKVLFVKSEFFLVPFFKENKLLGHQHVYLHDHGFRMIGMQLDKNAYMQGVRSKIPSMADTRLIYGGDAYFMLDPVMNKLNADVLLRMGIISLALGFRSLAISFLTDSRLVSEDDLIDIEKALEKLPLKKRLKYLWQTLPDKILKIIRR